MKKTYLLLTAFISFSITLFAQDYLPFPTQNATWSNALYTVEFFDDGGGSAYYELSSLDYYCTANADTIIGGETYAIIQLCEGWYKGALRDEDGKVYFVPKDSTEEFLLYDFTVMPGDVVTGVYTDEGITEGLDDLTVESVSTVEVGGISRRVIQFDGEQWIEGIGCTKGLFKDIYTEASEYGRALYCMSANDTTFYAEGTGVTYTEGNCVLNVGLEETISTNDVLVFPNPAKEVVYLDFASEFKVEDVQLMNMEGKLFTADWSKTNNGISISVHDLPKGVYSISMLSGKHSLTKTVLLD